MIFPKSSRVEDILCEIHAHTNQNVFVTAAVGYFLYKFIDIARSLHRKINDPEFFQQIVYPFQINEIFLLYTMSNDNLEDFMYRHCRIVVSKRNLLVSLFQNGAGCGRIQNQKEGRPMEEKKLPHDHGQSMERELEQLRTYYDISVKDVICLDSSNIRPEEWQLIARHVFEDRAGYDGIVVSHGTDTMAYTASAVTFMLPNIDIPVVFTGSQLPLTDMLSDGPDNLRTAFAMAASGAPGVFLAFDRKVMLGCRAVKVRASGFSAFESVNARYAALVSNRGLVVDTDVLPRRTGESKLLSDISKEVFLLKLTPGLNPAIFDMLAAMGYKGIVIEAFGLGGVNVLHRGLRGIHRCVEDGVSVVVTTQCLYDSADLQVYQVGSKLLELGVIQGRDMTSEAAMTKLMWAIGQGMNPAQVSELFGQNLAGEVTI